MSLKTRSRYDKLVQDNKMLRLSLASVESELQLCKRDIFDAHTRCGSEDGLFDKIFKFEVLISDVLIGNNRYMNDMANLIVDKFMREVRKAKHG